MLGSNTNCFMPQGYVCGQVSNRRKKYTAGISGVINNSSQQRYTDSIDEKETVVKANKSALTVISGITRQRQGNNSIDDLVRFVKRKIAKYNNYVSWQGPGVLLQTDYHASAGAYSTRFPLIKITPHHL